MTAPKLTAAQRRALQQLAIGSLSWLRAGRTGHARSLDALSRRGLAEYSRDHEWSITDAGRAALRGES